MENDIASMVYWYQEGAPRRFVAMPAWEKMLAGAELKAGAMDLPLPDDGSWKLGPVLENEDAAAIHAALKPAPGKPASRRRRRVTGRSRPRFTALSISIMSIAPAPRAWARITEKKRPKP